MRKILLAAVGFAALASAAGLAAAQSQPTQERERGGVSRFFEADANNDGNITREEFLAHPTEMFARLDTNSDGVISTAERPQRPERGERPGRGDRRERANPDTNNDGQLSQSEFAAMGAGMFERLDANSDGRVTRDEAAAAHPYRRGRD